jgi:lysophospholipase L1-like esterase
VRILGLGDSIIAGVGAKTPSETLTAQYARAWHERYQVGVSWKAYGRIGASTPKVKALIQKISAEDPFDIILISTGVNDILGLCRTRSWRQSLHELIDSIHQQYPSAQLIFLGIPPLHLFPALPSPLRNVFGLRAKRFDELAAQWIARQEGCYYGRILRPPPSGAFCADGFHPSADSYRELAQMLLSDLTPAASSRSFTRDTERDPMP